MEGCLAYECLTFCSTYFVSIEIRFNMLERNHEDVISHPKDLFATLRIGRPLGMTKLITFDAWTHQQVYIYILFKHKVVEYYCE